jgi:predicted small lipoprotein YifL
MKNNIFKKLITTTVLAAMCVSMAACGAKPDTLTPPDTTAPVQTTAPVETTAPIETTVPETVPVETTVPETVPVETTAPETVPEETTGELVMSDNPFDFMFSINGTVLQLPCTIKDLEDLGFIMDEDMADNILNDGYTSSSNMFHGKCYINVSIYNSTDKALPYKDCPVDDISVSVYGMRNGNDEIIFAGGITIGSTMDEVLAAYGEPYSEYTYDTSTFLEFRGANHRQTIKVQVTDGLVHTVDYRSDAEYYG